mmetsp:Transcript_3521/g.14606  ORF Transcript_3521/g.14606 Transcript_3521/m.14606 type:complete len:421 (-) Transcript_3521:2870-4132(-)
MRDRSVTPSRPITCSKSEAGAMAMRVRSRSAARTAPLPAAAASRAACIADVTCSRSRPLERMARCTIAQSGKETTRVVRKPSPGASARGMRGSRNTSPLVTSTWCGGAAPSSASPSPTSSASPSTSSSSSTTTTRPSSVRVDLEPGEVETAPAEAPPGRSSGAGGHLEMSSSSSHWPTVCPPSLYHMLRASKERAAVSSSSSEASPAPSEPRACAARARCANPASRPTSIARCDIPRATAGSSPLPMPPSTRRRASSPATPRTAKRPWIMAWSMARTPTWDRQDMGRSAMRSAAMENLGLLEPAQSGRSATASSSADGSLPNPRRSALSTCGSAAESQARSSAGTPASAARRASAAAKAVTGLSRPLALSNAERTTAKSSEGLQRASVEARARRSAKTVWRPAKAATGVSASSRPAGTRT